MDVSLDALETAVYSALAPLAASATPTPGPFRYVGRWAGEVRDRAGTLSLDEAAVGRNPALFLQWEGEEARQSFEGLEGAGSVETRGEVSLVAWIVVHDTRGPERLVKGATNTRGAGYLVDQLLGRLNALEITSGGSPALYRSTTLRYVRHRHRLADPAAYLVTEVRFVAVRSVPTVAVTDTTRDLLGLDGDVNNTQPPVPEPADETASGFNPLTIFRADT